MCVCVCVCEQLPGANLCPTVTKLGQTYLWPQRTRRSNFRKLRSKVKVGGEVCALLNALLVSSSIHSERARLNGVFFAGKMSYNQQYQSTDRNSKR